MIMPTTLHNPTATHLRNVKRIAILGGGMTGWTVAAGLANGLRNLDIEIALIGNSLQTEIDLHTETTTPACVAFHKSLGISESDLVTKTGASFLLATEFSSWSDQQQCYFMPFSDHGFMLNRIEFQQYAVSQYLGGDLLSYDNYSLASVAAKAGRFCHPSTQNSSLFSTFTYGLVLNTNRYADYLRTLALQLGVAQICADANKVKLDDQGYIESIGLTNANADISSHWVGMDGLLQADLFIDCTGIAAQLIEGSMKIEWLPLVNRVQCGGQSPLTHVLSDVKQSHTGDTIPVSRKLQSEIAGWVQTSATQTHVERQYFFHTDFINSEQACATLGADTSSVSVHELRMGRRSLFWHNNCIAIGKSACNPDQLGIGKLHLVQSAVLRLLSLFPKQVGSPFNRAEYNRLTHIELDNLEDFNALHYQLANTQSSDYWQKIARTLLSDRLLHKLELFKKRGLIPFYEGETFPASVWVSLLLGNGFWPQRYDPLICSMDKQWIKQQLEKMKNLMKSAAESMPVQQDYIRSLQQKMHSSGNYINTGYAIA